MSSIQNFVKHINDSATVYFMKMPSNEKMLIGFRPMRTKEQKQMSIIEEEYGTDEFLKLKSLINIIDACVVKNDIPIGDFTIEDFTMLLMEIKKKSLGEKVPMKRGCIKCKNQNIPFTIDLNTDLTVTYLKELKNNVLEVTDKMRFGLRPIKIDDLVEIMSEPNVDKRKEMTLAAHIDTVEFDEEITDIKTLADKVVLIDELSEHQLSHINKFMIDNTFGPVIKKEVACQCGCPNNVETRGLDIIDFF